MSKFKDSKRVGKRYKKTVRFDETLYSHIQGYANRYNLTFSDAVKNLLGYEFRSYENIQVEAKITPEDRKMLNLILWTYAHASNNLNQATHALNEMKNFSWLDLNDKSLDMKLDYISSQLDRVNKNFDDDQDVLSKFVKRVKKVR